MKANTELPILAVEDDISPLEIQSESEVFHEQGGADFTVTESIAIVNETGERVQFHTASVRQGKTGAVCIVEQSRDDNASVFLIARHWRIATKQWAWEFPRGMAGNNETPLATAIRELAEETGLCSKSVQTMILQHMHADTGVLRDDIAVFRVLLPSEQCDDSGAKTDWELTNLRWISADTIWRMIESGEITDGITLATWSIYCARFHAVTEPNCRGGRAD